MTFKLEEKHENTLYKCTKIWNTVKDLRKYFDSDLL